LVSILEESQKFENLLSELKRFFIAEKLEITKESFENSRKLINFFNGILKFFIVFNRVESLNSIINDNLNSINKELVKNIKDNICSNKNFIEEIKKFQAKISSFFKFFQCCKHLRFNKIIDFEAFNNLEKKELFEINLDDIDKQRCQLCLHTLDSDMKTRLFSGNFHITCINYWINLIDNNSPFN